MARYFLVALAFICVFAVFVQAHDEEIKNKDVKKVGIEHHEIEDTERANPAVTIVAKIIGSIFTGAATSCLGQAASNCKQYYKNPSQALSCARDFLKNNRGRCATGK